MLDGAAPAAVVALRPMLACRPAREQTARGNREVTHVSTDRRPDSWCACPRRAGRQPGARHRSEHRPGTRTKRARSAVLRPRKRQLDRREHVRQPDPLRFQAADRAQPGGVVESDRSADLGDQAAAGGKIPGWLGTHRKRCRLFTGTSTQHTQQPGSACKLCPAGPVGGGDRQDHHPRPHRGAGAAADGPDGSRVHHSGEARAAGDDRGFQRRACHDWHGTYRFRRRCRGIAW